MNDTNETRHFDLAHGPLSGPAADRPELSCGEHTDIALLHLAPKLVYVSNKANGQEGTQLRVGHNRRGLSSRRMLIKCFCTKSRVPVDANVIKALQQT